MRDDCKALDPDGIDAAGFDPITPAAMSAEPNDRAWHGGSDGRPIRGRGAASRQPGRFARRAVQAEDDGWESMRSHCDSDVDGHADAGADAMPRETASAPRPRTEVREERARRIISRNDSPDVGFSQSVNPYRGCEHGCAYCFARPSHACLDLSPGLDFETRLIAKTNAAERLRAELARPGYRCAPIALGINTDGYQPIERRYRVTRSLLEVLAGCGHPVSIVTKSALVLRDLDLLVPMAARGLATVYLSVTSLDNRLSAALEPRAAAPHTRLNTISALAGAGVPVGVLVAPVIPAITDGDLEAILTAARGAGAGAAGYALLRLPHELKGIWREWLQLHYPERAQHAMSVLRQMRGGRDYDAGFGTRMRGEGPFADLLAARFARARRRLGYGRLPPLQVSGFVPPTRSPQPDLFAGSHHADE